jgi:anthranilate phosphoribosyltransferase|tara:strand:+ start:1015 stop:2025 length:1011 start_codon:yes stop_codon:yes gene_type:complete
MISEIINQLKEKKDLSSEQAEHTMNEIMSGNLSDDEIMQFLVALKEKGESIEEITACAHVMRQKAEHIHPQPQPLIDIVGTGGDKTNTFNISTASALVVAGCNIPVAKHGNKAVSSKAGAADVLTALGININLEPKQVEECINELGIGFMFAPKFHPAMKYAIAARKKLATRTIFNILGPLTNPASAPYELMGVFDETLVEPLAHVLEKLGCKQAMVVHGSGMDELTLTGTSTIAELRDGKVTCSTLSPEDVGLQTTTLEQLQGADAEANAAIIMNILEGKETGPKRDIVLLNAGAAIYIAGKAESIKEGIEQAKNSINSGSALEKLNKLKAWTNN